MAAAAGDGAVKPLQCAMKLANGAIELDTGNRPRVRRGEARRGRPGPEASPVGVGEGGAAGWAPARIPRWLGGAGLGCRLVTLDSSQPSVYPSVQRVGNWRRGLICEGATQGL